MSAPNGITAKVTKMKGRGRNRMAFVVPQAEAPADIAKGDWFRVPCAQVGDEGVLLAPTPGSRLQQWLFAPARMNPHWQESAA